jgi:acetolactate synthase-1/2/3 large subunit
MAKGLFPEDHSYFAGVLDMAGYRVIWDFLADADLILAAGFDPVELISPWGLSTPVLHLDTTPNTDQVYASEHEVVGNVAAILDWIAAHWSGEPRRTEQEVAAHRASLRQAWLAGHVPDALNPSDVVTSADDQRPVRDGLRRVRRDRGQARATGAPGHSSGRRRRLRDDRHRAAGRG